MALAGRWTEHRYVAETADQPGLTLFELDSGTPGPAVLVLGGVHGNEVGGVVAAGRLTSAPLPLTAGRLRVVPVTHESAYAADSRVSPDDGGNLARVFPGRPDGTVTEQLAHLITSQLLSSADILIDLHTSNPDTDMPLLVGCLDDGQAAANRAVELALAFAPPTLWTHPRLGPGRTLTTARDLGIPAVYVESPAGGVLAADHVDAYVSGVRRVLAHLGMLPPDGEPGRPALWLHSDGDVDAFTHVASAGLFQPSITLLDTVAAGDIVGTVLDTRARAVEQVRAPDAGYVVTLRRTAKVTPGTPVVCIAPARPGTLGLPSDALNNGASQGDLRS